MPLFTLHYGLNSTVAFEAWDLEAVVPRTIVF